MCNNCNGTIKKPFPKICPKCNTITKWKSKEECLNNTILAELNAWAYEEQIPRRVK